MIGLLKKIGTAVALLVVAANTPLRANDAQEPTASLFSSIELAARAYIYGYPMVLMDVTRQATVGNEFNRLNHLRQFPDHDFRRVVRPNVDTLYSTIWFDLSAEPMVLELPPSEGRYYLMPIHDAWTNVFASLGNRTTGNGAYRIAVVGPDWQGELPDGLESVRSPTKLAWAIGRLSTPGGEDFAAAYAFQDGMTLTPLSNWQAGERFAGKDGSDDQTARNPKDVVGEMETGAFFNRLAALMIDNSPSPADGNFIETVLKPLGIVPGQPFDFEKLGFFRKLAMGFGAEEAREIIPGLEQHRRKNETYWTGMPGGVKLGSYGTRYPLRAYVALAGLGANGPEDAIYPNTGQSADGAPLDATNNYVLRFEAGALPPVHGFWSLTTYNSDYYLAENPIGRYALGDRDALSFNEDGSLDIYIQATSPGPELESNWLPTPAEGAFSITMRLYWPKVEVLEGNWKTPGIERR